ncbi:MAG TPA: alkaline phosphatase family protein [Thermoanaerobaculia bacterium]|nr:alkaline phosphatase family protein [Thermoanaerobaculia bacterium]
MTRNLRTILATMILFLAAFSLLAADRPDLVVVISIDQFPYSYIERFQPYFSDGGFNRFLKKGADFQKARYTYATTYTGPAHAAIGTGRVPSASGIIGNSWFDRVAGSREYCVADARATPVDKLGGGMSPLNLASDSLGDRLQEKYPGAKVFGVSIKDRAAILMAGRKATAAFWYDAGGPGFVSSSYYRIDETLRQLLAGYNHAVPDYVKAHPVWEQSGFIPAADLERLTHDPEKLRQYKTQREGVGVAFPHPIKGAEALTYTPFGNGLVFGFVEQLIDAEHLGTDDGQPDLVYLSLSSPDYLGHSFGPDSLEVADTVVRTDRDLASFLDHLEQKFGKRVTVALTADHGVQSIPEVAKDMGRDAGRLDMRDPGANVRTFAELGDGRRQLEKTVAKKLGLHATDKTPIEHGLILAFEEPGLYLNWVRIRELKLSGELVKRVVRDAARTLPGVSGAFTDSELLSMNRDPAELEAAVRRSFRADRSGDVLVTLRPGWIWSYGPTGTTHGQPVEADQHVPVMLWGAGGKPGAYENEAAPTDLARTLGSLLGVQAGGPDTQVLPCVSP